MLHQNVRFTPKSGHAPGRQKCPLSAKSRHSGDQTNHGRLLLDSEGELLALGALFSHLGDQPIGLTAAAGLGL